MKHTPSPWELLDGRNIKTVNGIFFLSYGCDEHSKKPFFFSKENGWSELDANAKLTAAAPELLDALKEMLVCFVITMNLDEHDQDFEGYKYEAVKNARAAVLKATGEVN